MRILVTGGAGFIGSNFLRYIIEKYPDYKVVNLDKLTYAGNLENLRDVKNNSNYRFIRGDICDKKTVDSVVKAGVDAILNFAADSHVDRSILGPESLLLPNILRTDLVISIFVLSLSAPTLYISPVSPL